MQVVETLFDTFLIVIDSTPFHRGNPDFMSDIHLFHFTIGVTFVKVFPLDVAGKECPVPAAAPAFLNMITVAGEFFKFDGLDFLPAFPEAVLYGSDGFVRKEGTFCERAICHNCHKMEAAPEPR